MEGQTKKDIQLKVLKKIGGKLKEKLLAGCMMGTTSECPPDVSKAIASIKQKMSECKIGELHPPFLVKTVTKYRHEYFMPLKKEYSQALECQDKEKFKGAISVLSSFVTNFDCEVMDNYLEQIRQPYIRKIFNQNYEFDKIDFKELTNQYKIRSEVQNLLNSASEWLIQIELTQDLLQRIQLYLNIQTPMLIEKAKKQGVETHHKSMADAIRSAIRNLTSYTLRKSSKVIQSSFFTAMAPAAVMLTLAIIGGSATLPWQSDINAKLLIAPIAALTVPYLLDTLASSVERNEFIQKLQEWAIALEEVSSNIAKFNEELEETLLSCCTADNLETFTKEKTNLIKYVKALQTNLTPLKDFTEEKFQEMRDRTEAYFKNYVEIQDGEWKIVLPQQESGKK